MSIRWLQSLCFSLLESILISQPIMVLLFVFLNLFASYDGGFRLSGEKPEVPITRTSFLNKETFARVYEKKTEQVLSLLLVMYLKREQAIPKWTRSKCWKPVTKSAGKRVRIVFGLSSDFSIIWREICDPITKRSPNHFSYWKELCLMERRPANSSSQVWSID